MQIEVGKFYRTRDGRKVGPARLDQFPHADQRWRLKIGEFGGEGRYPDDGLKFSVPECSLVGEWVDDHLTPD